MDGWETAARPLVNLLGDNLDWDHAAEKRACSGSGSRAAAFDTEDHGSVDRRRSGRMIHASDLVA